MMVGLVTQVVTLGIFGAMATDVYLRIRKNHAELNHSTQVLRNSKRFKGMIAALVVAYLCISIRCIYRIAEMAGGWGNPIMKDEPAFVVLDGFMCVVAVLALNIFHPGFLFKESYATVKAESMDVETQQVEMK